MFYIRAYVKYTGSMLHIRAACYIYGLYVTYTGLCYIYLDLDLVALFNEGDI